LRGLTRRHASDFAGESRFDALKDQEKHSHGQILKSSGLIGIASLLNVGFSIIRAKAMALLIGATGTGLFGNYNAISDLVRTVGGLGINVSGVREIAAAVGTGDEVKIARTVSALRQVAVCSGAIAALVLLVLCRPVARFTFGDDDHAWAVALLALAVFFLEVSAGQAALVQGMRRIGDLARMNVWGALFGTVFSIPIVLVWGERGVVPSLVCVAGMGILTSWWYARKVKVQRVWLGVRGVISEASGLVKLGLIFMSSAFMTMGVTYLVRTMVTRHNGLDDAGYYQAAWALAGQYAGYVLTAMAADFYPRLTAAATDNSKCNRLVNEQTEVGLLIAGPGILATLTFAQVVLQLFYSAAFKPAAELLCWISLGMLLRVASWPMGFILVAKGERQTFFWSEFVSNAVYLGLVWVGLREFGLRGAGLAFFGLYVLYLAGIYFVVRRLTGFRWSAANWRLAGLMAPVVALVFASRYYLPPLPAMLLGAVATVLAGLYSLKTVCGLVPLEKLPRPAQKLLLLLKFARLENNVETLKP
jgi:enterobacterial common antigen flippase